MCVAALPLSLLLPPIPLLSYEAAHVCRGMGRRNFILFQNVTLLMAKESRNFYQRISWYEQAALEYEAREGLLF